MHKDAHEPRHVSRVLAVMVMVLMVAVSAMGATPTIRARIDSTAAMMGRMLYLRLETVHDSGVPATPEILTMHTETGVVTLLNDTVEIRVAHQADTAQSGAGRMKVSYTFPMQIFYPGVYTLPPFGYVVGKDTVYSNEVTVKINAPDVTANDSISPNVGPFRPHYDNGFQQFTDNLPDFIYYYWWTILLGIAIIAGAIYAYIRYRKHDKPLLPRRVKPQPKPYDVAIKKLQMLKESKLWEQGQEQAYFTRLTDILREYLQGRFGINAMEMTSRQIMEAVSKQDDARHSQEYMNSILSIADFVKFAKMRPLPDDNIQAFTDALNFVQSTKPADEDGEKKDGHTGTEKKGGRP